VIADVGGAVNVVTESDEPPLPTAGVSSVVRLMVTAPPAAFEKCLAR